MRKNSSATAVVVKYIGIRALALRYACTRRTIWRLVARGELPPPTYLSAGPSSPAKWRVDELDAFDAARDAEYRSPPSRLRRASRADSAPATK